MTNLLSLCVGMWIPCAMAWGQPSSAMEEQRATEDFWRRYQAAEDKLGLLLGNVDSENESVLVIVVRELANFDNPQSRAALQKLRQHRQRNREGIPVADEARRSLEKLDAAPDLARLAGSPPGERRALILKYAAPGYTNAEGREGVLRYLIAEADRSPDFAVPLLVEYYADNSLAQRAAVNHPEPARSALVRALRSPYAGNVVGAIKLVAELKEAAMLTDVASFLCADRLNVPNSGIHFQTIATLASFGDSALPSILRILYSRNSLAQFDALAALEQIATPEAVRHLEEFRDYCRRGTTAVHRSMELAERAEQTIRAITAKRGP